MQVSARDFPWSLLSVLGGLGSFTPSGAGREGWAGLPRLVWAHVDTHPSGQPCSGAPRRSVPSCMHTRLQLASPLAPPCSPPRHTPPQQRTLGWAPALHRQQGLTNASRGCPRLPTRPIRMLFSLACGAEPAAYLKSSPYDLSPCLRGSQGQRSKTWAAAQQNVMAKSSCPLSSRASDPELCEGHWARPRATASGS